MLSYSIILHALGCFIFASYPKCEMVSEVTDALHPVVWCNTLSVKVGIIDVVVLGFIILVFLQKKGTANFCCAVVRKAKRASMQLTHHHHHRHHQHAEPNGRRTVSGDIKMRVHQRLHQLRVAAHRGRERGREAHGSHALSNIVVPSDSSRNKKRVPLPAMEHPGIATSSLPPLPDVHERVNQEIEMLHSRTQRIERSLTMDREGLHRKLEERRMRSQRKRSHQGHRANSE